MSSIVAITQTNAVHLITDGASYDPDGVVQAIGQKAEELPVSNCVYVVRGANYPRMPLSFLLWGQPSFDAIMDQLATIVERVLEMYNVLADGKAPPVQQHFEVTVAGWSNERQSWAVGIASTFQPCDPHDAQGVSYIDGYQPFVPFLAAPAYSLPVVDGAAVLGRTLETQEDIDSFDPVRDGLLVHEAQRLVYGHVGDGRLQYLVGGFAELVSVSRDGINRRILREWPDRVGELITPEGGQTIEDVRAALGEHADLVSIAA